MKHIKLLQLPLLALTALAVTSCRYHDDETYAPLVTVAKATHYVILADAETCVQYIVADGSRDTVAISVRVDGDNKPYLLKGCAHKQ